MPDHVVAYIWQIIEEQGLKNRTWSDGSVQTDMDFFKFFINRNIMIFLIYEDGLKGMCWLTGFGRKSAYGHFMFFREAWGKSTIRLGKHALNYWLNMEKDGEKIFDVIIGETPYKNRQAVKFIQKIGFKIIGEVPNYAVFSYARLENG